MTATTSSQEKINWLLGLPNRATHAANYKTEDFSAIVKQITGGKGIDVVIDFVGQSHFNKNPPPLQPQSAVDGGGANAHWNSVQYVGRWAVKEAYRST